MSSKDILERTHETTHKLFHQLFLYELFYKLSPKNSKTILKIFSMLIAKDNLLYNELKTLTEHEMDLLYRIDENLPKTIIEMFHFNSFLETRIKIEDDEFCMNVFEGLIMKKDANALDKWLRGNHKKVFNTISDDSFKNNIFEYVTNDTLNVLQRFSNGFLSQASDWCLRKSHSSKVIREFLTRDIYDDSPSSIFLAHFFNDFSEISRCIDISMIAKRRKKSKYETRHDKHFLINAFTEHLCINSLKELGINDIEKTFEKWLIDEHFLSDDGQVALNIASTLNLERPIKRYGEYSEQTISIIQLLLSYNCTPKFIEIILEKCPYVVLIRDSFGDNAFSYIPKTSYRKKYRYELFKVLYEAALKIMPEDVAFAMIFEEHRRKSCFKKLFNESYEKLLGVIDGTLLESLEKK